MYSAIKHFSQSFNLIYHLRYGNLIDVCVSILYIVYYVTLQVQRIGMYSWNFVAQFLSFFVGLHFLLPIQQTTGVY